MPSLLPLGLDPLTLMQERESRIRGRVNLRINELETVSLDSLPIETEAGGENLKLKAIIELKSLRLLEKQKQLRAKLLNTYMQDTTMQTTLSRHDYRRTKKPSVREIRVTEKMERQQRIDREKREKAKHYEYLNSIALWGRDMMTAKKSQLSKQMKLGRAVLHWHTNVEKEETKKQERMTKERIKALKADDEEAYMKLLDKQKDTRLTHLLE